MVHAIKQLSHISIKPPYGARSSPAMGELNHLQIRAPNLTLMWLYMYTRTKGKLFFAAHRKEKTLNKNLFGLCLKMSLAKVWNAKPERLDIQGSPFSVNKSQTHSSPFWCHPPAHQHPQSEKTLNWLIHARHVMAHTSTRAFGHVSNE